MARLNEDLEDLSELEASLEDPDSGAPPSSPRRSSKKPSSSPSDAPASAPKQRQKPGRKAGQATRREYWLEEFNKMAAGGAFAGGTLVSGVMPTTGTVLQIQSPIIGQAVEEAAKRDARIFAIAKAVYDSQMYMLFVTTIGAILVAVAIDLGRMPVVMAETPEGVVPNPVVRFVLPKEAMQVAISVDRGHRAARSAKAEAAAAAEPIRPPGWFGAEGAVDGTPAVSGG